MKKFFAITIFFALIVLIQAKFNPLPPRFVRTPGGWVFSQCIYQTESGSEIVEKDNRVTVIHPDGKTHTLPKCAYQTLPRTLSRKVVKFYESKLLKGENINFMKHLPRQNFQDGWQVWTQFNNINNATFDSFLGYFTVPTAPQNFDGGIVYIFTGLQNDDWIPLGSTSGAPPGFDIIQPVLQYGGDSEDGGGDYWALASWYVTLDDGAVWSTVEQVNDGDNIFGNMTRVGGSGSGSWYIGGVTQSGVNSGFVVTRPRLSVQNWAFVTLEAYDIDDCSNDFPPSGSTSKFTKMQLFDSNNKRKVTPQWQAQNNGQSCGPSISVLNPQTVTIQF